MGKYEDEYTKQALWEAHDKKCFYCKELLSFKNIHLDHVIPQRLFNKGENALRKKYNLNLSFDFNSVDNLAPACQSCNSKRKRGKELENGIPLWLDEIKLKKDDVSRKSINLRKELSLDLPDQYKEFFISSPSFMLFNLPIDHIRKKDIPLYKELVFCNDFSLVSPLDGSEVPVNTLKLYEEYSEKGYYALTSYAIGTASLCDACLMLFEMLEKAAPVKHKIEFRDYVRELPIDILFGTCFEDQAEALKKYESIGKFIDAHVLEGTSKKITYLKNKLQFIFKYEEFNQQVHYEIKEVVQADFSGEGNNEVILFVFYHSGGTLHFTYPYLMTHFNDKWHTATFD